MDDNAAVQGRRVRGGTERDRNAVIHLKDAVCAYVVEQSTGAFDGTAQQGYECPEHLKKPHIYSSAAIEGSQRTLRQAQRVGANRSAGRDRQHEVLANLSARCYRCWNIAARCDVGGKL